METIKTSLPYLIIAAVGVYLLMRNAKMQRISYLKNDLSKDYTRWTIIDLKIAGYIALFLDKKTRANDHFNAVVYAVLKRSEQAVDKKMYRILSVGANGSSASVSDEEVALLLSQDDKDQNRVQFVNDLFAAGATPKQVEELKKYI